MGARQPPAGRTETPGPDRAEPDPTADPRRRPLRFGRRRFAPPARRHPEQRSLFLEILDWMLVPLLLLWPLSIGITFLIARSLADAPFDRALVDRVAVVAQQLRSSRGASVPVIPQPAAGPGPQDAESEGEPGDDRLFVQILGVDGALVAGEPDFPAPALHDYPDQDRIRLRNDEFDGRKLRVGYVAVDLDADSESGTGTGVGQLLVQLGEPLAKRNRLANEIIKGVIFPQFVILPGAALLVWFGLGRGLASLQRLQQRIRGRDPDDASPIDPRGAPAEVGPLIDAFNDLLARQAQSVRAQKRFIADAAHQIKTPLAGLQTQAELALRSHDPAEVRRSLEQLLRSSARAARMVSQLLAMARAEHAGDAPTLTPLDLVALARDTVGDWVPAALARDIDIGFDAPETALEVDGHPILLREMLNNLLDNALRYTPRGGSVSVRVARDGTNGSDDPDRPDGAPGTVRLEVTDSGPGIPEAERELVFEPFYRMPGTQADGSGLGLSIVREIARQHGAGIAIEPAVAPDEASAASPDDTPAGTRFVLRFRGTNAT